MSAKPRGASFDISEGQRKLLNEAAERMGLPSADAAAEALVKQKLDESARRVGRDGRGKAVYRPTPKWH